MIYSYNRLGTFGALGNQLWEIASTIGIAISNDAGVSFPPWEYEQYFNVPHKYFLNLQGEIDLSGDYLQDLKHFEICEDLIRLFFKPSILVEDYLQDRYAEILALPNKTAIHVRRANNLQLPMHHPVCSLEYFEQAIDMLKPANIVVFSDDLDWCRSQSIFANAFFAEGNSPNIDIHLLTNGAPLSLASVAMDLHFMAKMDSHIISNSTFSWWSAWLANKKHVIIPKPWYGPALSHIDVKATMTPHHWVELERQL